MTKLKFQSAALIAVAVLASPAIARESHASSRREAVNADASIPPGAQYVGGEDRFHRYEGHDV
jgi:hypothetical protein